MTAFSCLDQINAKYWKVSYTRSMDDRNAENMNMVNMDPAGPYCIYTCGVGGMVTVHMAVGGGGGQARAVTAGPGGQPASHAKSPAGQRSSARRWPSARTVRGRPPGAWDDQWLPVVLLVGRGGGGGGGAHQPVSQASLVCDL